LASGMYLLSTTVGFGVVTDGVTSVSRLKLPLPKFHIVRKGDENYVHFSVRVEMVAKSIVGSYSHPEHVFCMASLPYGPRSVPYGPRSVPSTEAHTKAWKKRKMDAAGKTHVKRTKAPGKKNAEALKIVVSQAKTGSK
jgi:hypothetical protein